MEELLLFEDLEELVEPVEEEEAAFELELEAGALEDDTAYRFLS